jgi:hypothetical protein
MSTNDASEELAGVNKSTAGESVEKLKGYEGTNVWEF